jgi:hypothetical protein
MAFSLFHGTYRTENRKSNHEKQYKQKSTGFNAKGRNLEYKSKFFPTHIIGEA